MNSLIPRRSAESVCLFCRQGMLRDLQAPSRLIQHTTVAVSQRRRFLSGSTTVQMAPPPFAQTRPAEQSTDQSSTAAVAPSKLPYTRYSLYADASMPMTMQPPPPPPPPKEPVASVKEATKVACEPAKAAETQPEASASAVGQQTPTSPMHTMECHEAAPVPSATTAARSTAAVPAPKKRASRLRTPRKAAMRLTPAAVAQVRELLDGPEPKLIKVGVRNRGCSGLAYNLEYVDKPGAFDELVEQDGVRVLVDSKALFSIIGSEMDWVEDKLNQRFVFRNPNIKEQCGCGESFMV